MRLVFRGVLPDRSAQIMLGTDPKPAGPMYLVDDLPAWMAGHDDVEVRVPRYEIPGGSVAGFAATDGIVFYVFDQPGA